MKLWVSRAIVTDMMKELPTGSGEQGPLPGQWLSRAKLSPPSQDLLLVERKALLDLIDSSRRSTLSLVVAPAGFGKTSLVAQWRQRRLDMGEAVAWLTLDEADAEPHQFLAYVVTALAAAGLNMGSLGVGLAQGTTRGELEPAVYALLDIVSALGQPVSIILDDYHRAEASATNAVLRLLIIHAPTNLSIVVDSRTRPAVNLAQLIANGRASEIDVEKLRFTEAETGAALGFAVADDRLRRLHERAAGWPVAVQLARVLIGADATGDGDSPLDGFDGSTGHIASYLSDEVLSGLPDDLQDFLIQTSLLERFNVDLTNAVTGRHDASACMKRLEHLRALIMPLADSIGWFRYHHLFAECLQDHLTRRFPERIEDLHGRASLWFAKQGDVVDAVRHARAAGDFDRCAELIARAGGWELITNGGGIGYLRNLLQNLPVERIEDYPRILLAKSYLEAKDGHVREARAFLDAAMARPANKHDLAFKRDALNVQSLVEDYEDPHVTSRSLKLLEEKIASVPATDATTHGTLACQRMLNLVALGRLTEAEVAVESMVRAMRQAGSVLGVNYSFVHMALIALYQGRFNAAETHIAIAGRMAEANFGADSGLRSLVDTVLGSLRLWQGQLEGAALDRFVEAAAEVESNDGWLEIYLNVLDVEAELDPAAAIARAERLVEARGLGRLELHLLSHKLRVAHRGGKLLEAEGLAQRLLHRLPDGIWRNDPFLWRAFVESRLALALTRARADRPTALRLLDDAHECCARVGAQLFRIDTLVLRAGLLHQSGDRAAALAILSDALYLAVPERICRPFLRDKAVVPLLRTLRRTGGNGLDILVTDFITELLGRLREAEPDRDDGLSEREREVLDQLIGGLSNKEIARALDMTEHTVKFHLKNLFAKLEVRRRSDAIAKIRQQRD